MSLRLASGARRGASRAVPHQLMDLMEFRLSLPPLKFVVCPFLSVLKPF
jgi:hypothetical protein